MAINTSVNKTLEAIDSTRRIIDSKKDFINVTQYTPGYIDAVFTVWYSSGKLPVYRLMKMLPDPAEFGVTLGYPSEYIVRGWIKKDFFDRAAILDDEVSRKLSERLIAEKVQMLEAHAVVASEMQNMALTFLRENVNKLNANSAVRLLVEGVRIERESKGIPRTLEKLADRSDEELLAQIEDMLLRTPAQLESPEEETDAV